MRRLVIHGWRFLAHSYSLVNQFQCLEMLGREGLEIFHQDAPLPHPNYVPTRGVFDAASEARLAAIPPPDGVTGDATYRIAFPYDLRVSASPRTVVFATVQSAVRANYLVGGGSLGEAMAHSNVTIVTPSRWSRDRLVEAGAPATRVAVVPHGVDPAIFHPPTRAHRENLRQKAQCGDGFVFLHVGAMTGNKNIDLLLRAFAHVARHHPNVRLALKGLDPLYHSRDLLGQSAATLSTEERDLVQPRLGYWGGVWPNARMAELYQSADAYVSPYSAEGFNLPALEAAACGLPVLCTAGGPTDEFTTPDFAMPIRSTAQPPPDASVGLMLAPDLDSLVSQMLRIIEDSSFRAAAAAAGPAFIHRQFTWKIAVDRLLEVLFPGALS